MKIKTSQLQKIIQEEIKNLFEQPNVAPTSHVPDVGAPAGSMIATDVEEIENLDREIKKWTKIHEEVVEKAKTLAVDPQLLEYYRGDFEQLMTAMMDMLYQQYQVERATPRP